MVRNGIQTVVALVATLFVANASAISIFKKSNPFEYFVIECSIFNRDGKILFNVPNFQRCLFFDDGSLLASSNNTQIVKLIDAADKEIWSSDKLSVHHDMNFSNDQSQVLLITSEFSDIDNKHVRSDCVSAISTAVAILKKWCLSEHIEELKKMGLKLNRQNPIPFFGAGPKKNSGFEISHFNSFYEIPKNSQANKNAVFKEGNFIVNDWGPENFMFVLDKDLKKILWHKNFADRRTHDVQVTASGTILFYANQSKDILKKGETGFSQLIEMDPLRGEILWKFPENPGIFFNSEVLGSVARLVGGNYLYSDQTNGGKAFEINAKGKTLWKFENPAKDKFGKPYAFQSIKPLANDLFLRKRKIVF